MSTHNTHLINLVVAAAFYHPEKTVRARLCSKLEGWLKKLGDRADAEQIRTVLEKNKGTYLEPFVLSKADLDCSVFLARLAFSRTAEQTRFRVVSRDTIGTDGGLVLGGGGHRHRHRARLRGSRGQGGHPGVAEKVPLSRELLG